MYGKLLTRKEVECALEEAKASVKRNMEYLNGKFPFSAAYNSEPFPSERDGMYPITEKCRVDDGILDRTNLADVRLEQGSMF